MSEYARSNGMMVGGLAQIGRADQAHHDAAIAEQRAFMAASDARVCRMEAMRLVLPHYRADVDGAIDAAKRVALFLSGHGPEG